jgi:DNA repair protein RecN (Recombination protein N)
MRLERRRAELERAAETLAVDPDELASELLRQGAELASLQAAEARMVELDARRTRTSERAQALARVLHEGRSRAAGELSRRLEAELADLCLPDARWSLELRELAGDALNALGMNTLAVSFAANPGEPFGPLARVASGGERSRLLLALRALGIGARAGARDTLVFDEVDAGVGGEAAEAVALRLVRLASLRQVIVVTHQASIAARAAAHFRVSKQTRDGRTRAQVERLPGTGRVDELARMLSGRAHDESARTLALEMLERAEARSVAQRRREKRHKGRQPRAFSGRAA